MTFILKPGRKGFGSISMSSFLLNTMERNSHEVLSTLRGRNFEATICATTLMETGHLVADLVVHGDCLFPS